MGPVCRQSMKPIKKHDAYGTIHLIERKKNALPTQKKPATLDWKCMRQSADTVFSNINQIAERGLVVCGWLQCLFFLSRRE